jgi:hypothetical protein
MNPQLTAGGFEGDMIFPDGFDPTDSSRGVAIYGDRKWPNGQIPYEISAAISKCLLDLFYQHIRISPHHQTLKIGRRSPTP